MHEHHDVFIAGLEGLRRVTLTFFSREDGGAQLVRSCAPMDFGPSRRANNKSDRYHLWDYDSDRRSHVLGLLPFQIVSIEATNHTFAPAEFVTWSPIEWFYPRDWGVYS